MNVLLIGHGGREHAIAHKLRHSKKLTDLFSTGNNPGINLLSQRLLDKVPISRHEQIDCARLCLKHDIELVIVGPEDPLAAGLFDQLTHRGIKVFGASKHAAQLESSKEFGKNFMGKYRIPTAAYTSFANYQDLKNYIRESKSFPIVIKADGLAAGKGVIILNNHSEIDAGLIYLNKLGDAAQKIIVENYLDGWELSAFALLDNFSLKKIGYVQDHKKLNEGNAGPNTGGMGAYTPVPQVTQKLDAQIQNLIWEPLLQGLKAEKMNYRGVIYAGLMIVNHKPQVLEFNVRFGDPEAQVLLPIIQNDMLDLFLAAAENKLSQVENIEAKGAAACVVLASKNYPYGSSPAVEIHGLHENFEKKGLIFYAGVNSENSTFYTIGGRILSVVGLENQLSDAAKNAYNMVNQINFSGMHYRKDIAHSALNYNIPKRTKNQEPRTKNQEPRTNV